jgi:hypothetical protein
MVLQEKDGAELRDLLKEHQVLEHRQLRLPDGEVLVRILLDAERNEAVLDLLENRYTGEAGNRVVVLPVEATLPRAEPKPEPETTAAPDAKATVMSPSPTPLRDAISGVAGSTCSSTPMITDSTIVIAIPVRAVRSARRSRVRSPRVVASASAMFGPSKGAITIAPMMIATLL